MRVPCGEHGGWGRHGGLWDAGDAPGADGAGSWECSLCDHAVSRTHVVGVFAVRASRCNEKFIF